MNIVNNSGITFIDVTRGPLSGSTNLELDPAKIIGVLRADPDGRFLEFAYPSRS